MLLVEASSGFVSVMGRPNQGHIFSGQSFREGRPEFGGSRELREPVSQLPEEPEGAEDVGQGAPSPVARRSVQKGCG